MSYATRSLLLTGASEKGIIGEISDGLKISLDKRNQCFGRPVLPMMLFRGPSDGAIDGG